MGYSDGEALIFAKVKECSNFDATNTYRANWKPLNQGKDDHYAILRPGPFEVEWISYSHYVANWVTVVEVWQRYKDETDTHTDLYDRVEDLFDLLNTPRLGDTTGTVVDSSFVVSEEPQEMWIDGGGPAWLRWNLNMRWQEENEGTLTGTISGSGFLLLESGQDSAKTSGLTELNRTAADDKLLVYDASADALKTVEIQNLRVPYEITATQYGSYAQIEQGFNNQAGRASVNGDIFLFLDSISDTGFRLASKWEVGPSNYWVLWNSNTAYSES